MAEFLHTMVRHGIGDSRSVLELTYNHDGRSYELGTGYGHIALAG